MASNPSSLLSVYGRNVAFQLFKKGWSTSQLATFLNISTNATNRLIRGSNSYIDPTVLDQLIALFQVDFNQLLQKQEGVAYDRDA